ncbi:hypothetical protein ACVME9_005446 [Bradyrhizobium liaoningense]
METAELGDDQIGIGRRLELDRDIGFEPRDVGLLHRAAQVDRDLAVGLLEVDQSRQDPEIPGAFRHRDAHGARGVVRRSRGAAEDVEGMTLHMRNVGDHCCAFIAERESALVAQEQLAPDPLFEPIDAAHQGRGGEPEFFGRIAETFIFCAR